MFGRILRWLGFGQDLVCHFCKTKVYRELARRQGWVKMPFGWVCRECIVKDK